MEYYTGEEDDLHLRNFFTPATIVECGLRDYRRFFRGRFGRVDKKVKSKSMKDCSFN